MKIETLDDANDVISGCGCCPMPACPVPTTECKSIYASATSDGYFKTGQNGDAQWTIYRKRADKMDLTRNYTDTYRDYNGSAFEYSYYAKERNFTGSINLGGNDCQTWENPVTETCDTGGLLTDITYNSEWNGSEWVRGGVFATETTTRTNLTGQPIPGSDPPANYPVCSWKDTVAIDYADDDDGEDSSRDEFNVNATTMYPIIGQGNNTTTFTEEYEFGKSFAAWIADTRTTLEAAIDVAGDECWAGTGCDSQIQQSVAEAPANGNSVWLSVTLSKYRWVVPGTWTGSYFKITWDVLEEPDGWNANPPTAARSFVSQDNTWVWTGPGDQDDPDSWKSAWHDLGMPAVKGKRRIVNVRYECYKSSRLGLKPHATGDAVELPDP